MAKRLAVIENSTLDAMLADPRFAGFGCLAALRAAPVQAGCAKCSRKPGRDASAYMAAKQCLASMPQAERDRLKGLMGASTVRVIAAAPGQAVRQLDF